MARKLKDALGMVAANPAAVESPDIKIPDADPAAALAEAARQGHDAVVRLYADRNKSVELAASLHREVVYLRNVNNGLRAEIIHAKTERDYYMQLVARIGAHVGQTLSINKMMFEECQRTAVILEQMTPPAPVTNNPEMPPVDTKGIPIEDVRQFDEHGIPYNAAAPVELREMISRIG